MSATAFEDRAAGALMGALIGDALGVGPHWYYNLHELRAAYGPWISDYTPPNPGRYHAGLKAGQSSQAVRSCSLRWSTGPPGSRRSACNRRRRSPQSSRGCSARWSVTAATATAGTA